MDTLPKNQLPREKSDTDDLPKCYFAWEVNGNFITAQLRSIDGGPCPNSTFEAVKIARLLLAM